MDAHCLSEASATAVTGVTAHSKSDAGREMVTKDFCNTDVADEQGQPSGVYVTDVSDVTGSECLESF